MTLKTRISKLEEQRSVVVEIADMATLPPDKRYLAMLDGPRPSPREIQESKKRHDAFEKRLGRAITPEEVYRSMKGELDLETLVPIRGKT